MKWVDTRKLVGVGLNSLAADKKYKDRWVTPYILDLALKRGVFIFNKKLEKNIDKYEELKTWEKEDIIADIWNIKACKVMKDGTWKIPFNNHVVPSSYAGMLELHIYNGRTRKELRDTLKYVDKLLYENFLENYIQIDINNSTNAKMSAVDIYVQSYGNVSEWADFIKDEVSKNIDVKAAYLPKSLETEKSLCTVWDKEEYFLNKKDWILNSYRTFEKNNVRFVCETKDNWELLKLDE